MSVEVINVKSQPLSPFYSLSVSSCLCLEHPEGTRLIFIFGTSLNHRSNGMERSLEQPGVPLEYRFPDPSLYPRVFHNYAAAEFEV